MGNRNTAYLASFPLAGATELFDAKSLKTGGWNGQLNERPRVIGCQIHCNFAFGCKSCKDPAETE